MPDWKKRIGIEIDRVVQRTVPEVSKAVKWNTPLYGIEDRGWFLAFHCFERYVKITFFRGAALDPLPPGKSKQRDVRYLNIHEADEIDELLLTHWIKQASEMPGEKL